MNTTDTSTYDVGVIVGRFQVPQLHDGHIQLIEHVTQRHKKVIVVLGVSPLMNTTNNPLDFESRRQMIHDTYPNVVVLYIKDIHNDQAWSTILDSLIGDVVTPTQSVVLYGGRDSFIKAYTGKYHTFELVQEGHLSGSEVRDIVRQESRRSEDFRAGVIWASANRFPTVYACVDVAIFKKNYTLIGLGQKTHETKWRLIGGFSDPGSPTFEHDAYREVAEETGMGLTGLTYLGSFTVNDWRYNNEPDVLRTLLFRGTTEDIGKAADDIAAFQWFDVEKLRTNYHKVIIPNHIPLIERVLESVA